MTNHTGKFGRKEHEEIIQTIRSGIYEHLSWEGFEIGEDYFLFLDEQVMMSSLGQFGACRVNGARIPDMLFVTKGTPVIIEVGNYIPSKWETDMPVVHVGFNHRVSLVNDDQNDLTEAILNGIDVLMTIEYGRSVL